MLSRCPYEGSLPRTTPHRNVLSVLEGLSTERSCLLTYYPAIYQAFEELGYGKNYDYGSVYVGNPRDAEMWIEALEAKYEGKGRPFGRKEWDQLLGHVMV